MPYPGRPSSIPLFAPCPPQAAEADLLRISNKVRFILAVVGGQLKLSNRRKAEVEQELEDEGYDRLLSLKKAQAQVGSRVGGVGYQQACGAVQALLVLFIGPTPAHHWHSSIRQRSPPVATLTMLLCRPRRRRTRRGRAVPPPPTTTCSPCRCPA